MMVEQVKPGKKPFVPDYKIILQSTRIIESRKSHSLYKPYKRDIGKKACWKKIFDWYSTAVVNQEIVENEDFFILRDILIDSQGYLIFLHKLFYQPLTYSDKTLRKCSDNERKERVKESQRYAKEFPYRLRKLIDANLISLDVEDIKTHYPIRVSLTNTGIAVLIDWMEDLERKGIYYETLSHPEPDYFASLRRCRDYYATKGIYWNYDSSGWYRVNSVSESYEESENYNIPNFLNNLMKDLDEDQITLLTQVEKMKWQAIRNMAVSSIKHSPCDFN